jgi:hypothetical protein
VTNLPTHCAEGAHALIVSLFGALYASWIIVHDEVPTNKKRPGHGKAGKKTKRKRLWR